MNKAASSSPILNKVRQSPNPSTALPRQRTHAPCLQESRSECEPPSPSPFGWEGYRQKSNEGLCRQLTNEDLCRQMTNEDIYRDIQQIFKTCRRNEEGLGQVGLFKVSREEQRTLWLTPELQAFSRKHRLRDQKVQIKYVNTLKRVKRKAKELGCEIRAKSEGLELQLTEHRQQKAEDHFRYTFGKEFGRFCKRKIVQGAKKCKDAAAALNLTVSNHSQELMDALKANEKLASYKNYDSSRMQRYLNSKAHQQKTFPICVKNQLEERISKAKKKQAKRESPDEDLSFSEFNSPKASPPPSRLSPSRLNKANETSLQLTKRSSGSKWKDFEQDIAEFREISHFFERAQNQILRYLPNNHIANKLKGLMDQAEQGLMISKIYRKCKQGASFFTPSLIVGILKKHPGILSVMNYIVNIIKLHISAERRKRFVDKEHTIAQLQRIITVRNQQIAEKVKEIADPELRREVFESVSQTQVKCLGLNPSYLSFVQANEQHEMAPEDHIKNRNIICEILKYEAMMK